MPVRKGRFEYVADLRAIQADFGEALERLSELVNELGDDYLKTNLVQPLQALIFANPDDDAPYHASVEGFADSLERKYDPDGWWTLAQDAADPDDYDNWTPTPTFHQFYGSDIIFPDLCGRCRYKHARRETCAAFPEGIPQEILSSTFFHMTPYEGDHGVQFRRIPRSKK